MRRVFWIGVGVAITVVVVVRGKKILARYAPASLVDQATEQVNGLGEKVVEIARDFRTEFTLARDAREQELMAALLAEGQEDPDVVRARRAAGRHTRPAAGDPSPFDDTDDVEDLLGYSF
ncbi:MULTISPECIES: hypothetical protein [Cellulosimicrobium]|jgi:hypothetical protein|uniref:Uncharacterized protein n=1 Tax=Cellulosimicrobium sp. ES-005 TaxID=3163031 RepID=A0AAU8G5G0_9MICO|nr:hypothetical protein [Cellulosimicrobium cellulans]MCO7271713.1 hypothetical protein [Cellulosimicrobium cellulans]